MEIDDIGKKFTYGLELEFVDFDRRDLELPEGCTWAKKEVTLVNSNGLAVDSTGKTDNWRGGEINTKPTESIDGQLKMAEECLKLLKGLNASVNYRCNLQVHIGGWTDEDDGVTLRRLKKIQKYAFENYDEAMMLTMGKGQFTKPKEMPMGTWAHYRERTVPPYKHDFLMAATDLKDYQMSFFKSKKGTHAPLTFMRQGINTHTFFKYKTIEFRIFWMTMNLTHMENALKFAHIFMLDALVTNQGFDHWSYMFKDSFPPELPFDSKLEEGFQKTKVDKPS